MPGWHAAVKDLVEEDKLVLLAITQEQHADRCELFAQWQGFRFPILHDPINSMNSLAVPLVVAIDEQGLVRHTQPTPQWVHEQFVGTAYRTTAPAPAPAPMASKPDLALLQQAAKQSTSAAAYRQLGDAAILWSDDVHLAVDAYESALRGDPSAVHQFRLGVALRRRHDSPWRRDDDFPRAVQHWSAALQLEPNQYIWRRRIQQYGPRLDKPYPFYDWIKTAQDEIRQRGATPVIVKVPLSGAEVASPTEAFEITGGQRPPDAEGSITRDQGHFVQLQLAAVPATIDAGGTSRLHLEFRLTNNAVWNNESEPLQVWIEHQDGWTPERSLLVHAEIPGAAESTEPRRMEVELQSSKSADDALVRGYALYSICDKATGTCLWRRQDFSLMMQVR